MTRSEIISYIILRSIGNFLLLFALFGVAATFGPALYYELNFRYEQAWGVTYVVADPKSKNAQESELGKLIQRDRNRPVSEITAGFPDSKQRLLIPKNTQFGLVIPKIGANATVIPNVDPGNEPEFLQALQSGVAHARGTVFPGQQGNIYLFAHSTDNWWNVGRYNAIFYLLKDVSKGDKVIVFFEDIRHNYVVTESKIVEANDISYLVDSQKSGTETLIMQTCWPPGTTWKRLLVFAKPERDVTGRK